MASNWAIKKSAAIHYPMYALNFQKALDAAAEEYHKAFAQALLEKWRTGQMNWLLEQVSFERVLDKLGRG